ncbi:prephenate dehydratase [Thermanaeromonas toyohensis ToBE]|uniref:Prephenate dehydratase n=1 Tax=Thermanaeromonas toyohensis ToBE TaxID=698762 RepID=A0A1W1VZP1_9FIRM|nr:prephenate dehydratase [Thermanaeromonas toyohensis]SMB98334.1 prephenate dehydratase [Thermanaeromonas toyohensis ToBE]
MNSSCKIDQVAYLGPEGTFSHEAAVIWGSAIGVASFFPVENLLEVVQAVLEGRCQAAILPLENSIEGSVNLTQDLLLEEPALQIVGEVVLEVRHCLASKETDPQNITEVWSHPHALAQCRRFLASRLPKARLCPATSTAGAFVLATSRKGSAAIGSSFAARLYGLPVLYQGIEDYPGNKTRFVIVSRERVPGRGPYKTSLVLALPENRPGGLYNILRDFAEAGINLTRIESRPTKKELGEYLFFLDCEGHAEREPLAGVLAALRPRTSFLRVLGSYPCYREGGKEDD